ncbi:MAG: phosphodiester glycosidase family protein [Chloroflexi bacterium]|nr:MAG: phosphodiester glycosidase family protein [Chloroflexota bacterium]
MGRSLFARVAGTLLIASTLVLGQGARPANAACVASTGPGIPAPTGLPTGISGFHARWYGQSGYPTLCPGGRSTATVAFYNSGSLGWVSGRMGEVAYLGTWGPEPGQDAVSPLGGDGTAGSLATGWPRYNRITMQPAPYVGPGQVAWFQFTIQAPDGSLPTQSGAVYSPLGYSDLSVPTARGAFSVHLIKERLADVTVRTLTANSTDCASDCPAKPLAQYVAENGAYAGMNGTYLCPPDYPACAGKVNSYDYAVYNSNLRRWINRPALIGQNSLLTFNGAATAVYRRSFVYGQNASLMNAPITAGITMFPLLVQDGAVIDSEFEQTAVQKTRGTKGAIGVDGTYIYLAIVTGATVTESAYVLQALGARDALNLDGGGTAAMFIGGSYTVGPGRLLPNAIVLTKP